MQIKYFSLFVAGAYSIPQSNDFNSAAFRAANNNNGILNLVTMVRTNICRVFYPTKSLRKCPAKIPETEDALRNYGCNCLPANMDDDPIISTSGHQSYHMGKNGRPISDLDSACTRLRDSYTCIVIDTDDGLLSNPDSASPDNQDYCGRFTEYEMHIDANKEIICGPESDPEYASGAAEDICRLRVCEIERQFAAEAFTLLGDDPSDFQAANTANYGIHSDASQCVNTNNGHGVSECCGDYPLRSPYIPFIKTCCNNAGVFSPTLIGEC